MTKEDKRKLLSQAVKLATLGESIERKREKLRRFIRQELFDEQQALTMLEDFHHSVDEWNRLETEHLALRKRLGIT